MTRAARLLTVLLLTGCAQTPLPGLKPGDVPAGFEQAHGNAPIWPTPEWWNGFGTPELSGLEKTVRENNLDIAQASSRLAQADARARQAGASLLPTLSLNSSSTYSYGQSSGTSGHETDFMLGLGASYELDFWGKNRAATDSAQASLQASAADRATVALTASSATANAYFQLLSLRERIVLARDNIESAESILNVVQRRVTAGYSPNVDLAQARADLAAQRAGLPPLEQQELETRTALAILLGRPPEAFMVATTSLSGITVPAVAPGLPSELLQRRPDITRAENDLAAAHADVAAARAAMLPGITLTANGGLQNPALNAAVLTLGGTGLGVSIGAALVQTIFDGGKLRAKTAEAQAREEELLAAYRSVVFGAFADVENALGNLDHLASQESALTEQVSQAERALSGAQRRYTAGGADFLVVTDAQRILRTARDQLSDVKRARLTASVTLFRVLGGGWDVH